MGDVVRVRAVVRGRVQGVFYRAAAEREAVRLGVAGSAANRPDGSVGLVLEGERAAVDAMLCWAADGPPSAQVTAVEVTDETPTGGRGFSTR
ncbi:MAG: acylphosphatase [Acidimicrobiales bacterium]